jgi:hypothetical protein
MVGDLRHLVVTNDRRERRHEHEGAIQVLLDLLQIRPCTLDQELAEVRTPVRQDGDGVSLRTRGQNITVSVITP